MDDACRSWTLKSHSKLAPHSGRATADRAAKKMGQADDPAPSVARDRESRSSSHTLSMACGTWTFIDHEPLSLSWLLSPKVMGLYEAVDSNSLPIFPPVPPRSICWLMSTRLPVPGCGEMYGRSAQSIGPGSIRCPPCLPPPVSIAQPIRDEKIHLTRESCNPPPLGAQSLGFRGRVSFQRFPQMRQLGETLLSAFLSMNPPVWSG